MEDKGKYYNWIVSQIKEMSNLPNVVLKDMKEAFIKNYKSDDHEFDEAEWEFSLEWALSDLGFES